MGCKIRFCLPDRILGIANGEWFICTDYNLLDLIIDPTGNGEVQSKSSLDAWQKANDMLSLYSGEKETISLHVLGDYEATEAQASFMLAQAMAHATQRSMNREKAWALLKTFPPEGTTIQRNMAMILGGFSHCGSGSGNSDAMRIPLSSELCFIRLNNQKTTVDIRKDALSQSQLLKAFFYNSTDDLYRFLPKLKDCINEDSGFVEKIASFELGSLALEADGVLIFFRNQAKRSRAESILNSYELDFTRVNIAYDAIEKQ